MNNAELNELLAIEPSSTDRPGFDSEMHAEGNGETVQRVYESLRRRWWFYLFAGCVAAGIAFWAATEYGDYDYTAKGIVKANGIPVPPGTSYYTPPSTAGFDSYLGHPDVMAQLRDEFNILVAPGEEEDFFTGKYDRNRGVFVVESTRDDAEEAAAIVNRAIETAITKSTESRESRLSELLTYFTSLVGKAEAEAASKRLAKSNRLEALKERYSENREAKLEYESLTDAYRSKRSALDSLNGELLNLKRLQDLLRSNEQEVVNRIRDSVLERARADLEAEASKYAEGSGPAKDFAERAKQLETLVDETEVSNRRELSDLLNEVFKIVGTEFGLPAEDASVLRRIRSELYGLENQLALLPLRIQDAEAALKEIQEERAAVQVVAEQDFENFPEIIELSVQIDRAEANAQRISSAVSWVRDMQTVETPLYAALLPASPQRASPDGNHKKLFVGIFGLAALALACPILFWDLTRSSRTATELLSLEFGLPRISTQALETGRVRSSVGLQANDPELRLLASRIQRSARDARGSVVLFSSLSDVLSTEELTTTIANCLAAREERVMIVDLEPIDEHRRGEGLKLTGPPEPPPRVVDANRLAAANASAEADEPGDQRGGNGSGNGHQANGNGHLTYGKMGLALALAGATKNPDDVLVEHGSDGIDRLNLGEGELPVEAFASPLMGRLLDRYRNEYSMVLLSGPAAKHIADVQMLASRCDGTLFVAPNSGAIALNARRTIVDLIESRAPIMGIAQVPS